jgi:hypothetical protein
MAIINHELVHDVIPAENSADAIKVFEEKFSSKPKEVLGPFIKRKSKPIQITTSLKFDGKPRKAIYNGWLVNSFSLKEPENCVFIIFIKDTENLSRVPPKGTTIVPINEIRFI